MYIYIDIDTDIDIDDRWWDLSVPKDPFLRIQNSMKRNLKKNYEISPNWWIKTIFRLSNKNTYL